MGAVQKRLAQLGVAKQTAKGSAASAPTYTIGLTDGKVWDAEIEQEELDTTWSDRALQGHDRISLQPMSEVGFVATPKMIGLLAYLALGADAVTGTGPYTHAFTPASTLPYATLFGLLGTEKAAISDAKVDSLELSWDKSGAVKGKVKFNGCAIDFASAWAIGATAEVISSGAFHGGGGTFQIDGAAARIISGSIKIENNLEAIVASTNTTPEDVFEGGVKCEVSLVIKPENMNEFRRAYTSTNAGTTASAAPVYASTTLKWLVDANTFLQFETTRLAFEAHPADVDPAGGAAEVTVEGSVSVPVGGGTPFTVTVKNNVATY